MTQRDRVRDEAEATEPKFYLPAASARSLAAALVQRVRTALFEPRR